MKKLNKLFAILIAVLGVQTLSAQTDVTNTYLTNANFSSTSGWTQYISGSFRDIGSGKIGGKLADYAASSTDATHLSSEYFFGFQCRWNGNYSSYNQVTSQALPSGVYTLSYDVENVNGSTSAVNYNNLFYVKVGDKTFTDTSVEWMKGKSSWTSHSITFVITEATKATVSLGYGTGSNNLPSGNTPVLYVSHLKLTHRNIDDISAEKPADLTSYIVNNSFENGNLDGWTVGGYSSDTGVKPNSNGTYATSGVDGNYLYNTWWQGTPLTQTVANIPNGIYELKVLLASDQNAKLFLLANDGHSEVYTITTDNKTFHDVSYEFKVLNGQAKIGVVGGNDAGEYLVNGHWWYKADNFRLTYKGADVSLLQDAFNANYAKLEALSTNDVPTAFAQKISNLISTYETVPTSKKDLTTANTDIESVVNAHPNIVTAYANLTSLISLCTEYTDSKNSNANTAEVLTTFKNAINTATTTGNAATSVDVINTAYNNLENARRNYAQNAVPVYPYAFDMTFLLTNPNFDSNIDGWTATGGAGRMSAGNMECYNGNFTFALANKLTGLGNGTWEVSVDGFYRYGGYNEAEAAHNGGTEDLKVKFYANANEVALKSIMEGANKAGGVGATTTGGVRVPNSPADGNSYFPTGCYSNTVSTLVTDGTLTFGLKKESTQGSDWTLFDNFRLAYKGVDVSELQNSLSALIIKANAIKETKMGNTAKTTLTNALNAADATVTIADELNEMLSTLQSAYDAAMASIDTYSKVPAYIAKAKAIGVTLADTYQEQYDNSTIEGNAETVFQALEVATYNYVKENFPYDVELLKAEGWNSKGTNTAAGTFNNEHWSGTTSNYKNQQDGDNWGWGASAWSIDFDQSVTLPAGEYVFKVAGRKSAEATLELTVTMGATILGSVNDFPSSNNAKGINKAGATSFDANDPEGFANNGNGFGWQWRYVKFALATESTVKVAVHAETNAIHQWVSFGDYTLHMDESAYLETNKEGLVAPMAAAQALVGVKPMGKDEAIALQTAIDMPVTTGAELKAKIEALNAAVANANAWVPKYNEAKAPLVAALERFEADYNDAQNGSLNHMNKDRWATAIEKAQAAAVAKDVTDSYDGFEAAANDLVEALEAATISIGEYTELKAAIDNANELGGGDDWGNEPFQKSESAKESFNTTKTQAQTAYDVAEVDGEGVAAVIESLNNAIVLNAPAEGQRFYIKVATEGHGKNGNALLVTSGATGDNNPTGYGINANNAVKAHLPQAFIFTQVEGNLYNISIERAEGTVYLTYGSLNGSAAGWKNQQIQATMDAEKKGEFKIVPTGKNGVLKIFNTVDNNYLDCQDGGSIYTDTNVEKEEFAFELATETEVTLTLSKEGWATLILPFEAELPSGVKAYSCSETDGEALILNEATSIKANTPYLINGYESTHNFSGYGLADNDSYTEGLFTGTYVDYQTTANSNTYVLQNIDGDVAFYLVGESIQPIVRPYRIYMTYESVDGAAPKFSFGRNGGTTSIENMEPTINDQQTIVVYDLMGRKVNTMEMGKMYIMNGQKVIIK